MKVCPTCKRLYGSALGVCPGDGGILAALQEWRPGDSVSQNFRIIEKIGHGSIGAVFKAKLLPQGDLRVLKPLAAHLADHEFLIEYLRHKIEAASTLRHLNMVQIESLEWAADGRPFIVMEHAPGLSLRELLIRGGSMPARDVVDIAGQICAVLDCAHRLGVIHRNLKPENVIISEEQDGSPRVKVMELGMADFREAAAVQGKYVGDVLTTEHGPVVGTREYMSPEQATGTPASALDGRSDLYSLGVMMFEALTGELPIDPNNPARVLEQRETTAGKKPLCSTILRALHKDPDCRYQSATEMAADLRGLSPSSFQTTWKEAGLGARTGSVTLPLSSRDAQPSTLDVRARAATSFDWQPPERTIPRMPDRRDHTRERPQPSAAAASTDREIEEIRKTLTRTGWPALRQRGQRHLLRTGLLTLGFAMVALTAAWLAYRWPGTLSRPEGQAVSRQGTLASSHATVREPSMDLRSPDVNPPPPGAVPPSWKEPAAGQSYAPSQPTKSKAKRAEPPIETPPSVTPEAEVKAKVAAGWLHAKRKNYRAAIESFQKALEIDPANVEAQAGLRLAHYADQNPGIDVFPADQPAPAESEVKRAP